MVPHNGRINLPIEIKICFISASVEAYCSYSKRILPAIIYDVDFPSKVSICMYRLLRSLN
jgi:hypothetical protein